MSEISSALQAVLARIATAATTCGRDPATVQLLAVSKTKPLAAVQAALAAGQRQFGENYVQEGVDKIAALAASTARPQSQPQPVWHFIGPLQSNKTRPVAEHFDWVHGIERLKIAERLSQQRPAHLPPLQVCVQVNVSQEASKSGCALEAAAALCHAVAALPKLQLRGLMAIPAPVPEQADAAATLALQRAPFARLRELYEQLRRDGLALDTLSMGMSDDLEAAIMEGATLVRVGTAIFGARNYA